MTTTNPDQYKFMLTFRYFKGDPKSVELTPQDPKQTSEDS